MFIDIFFKNHNKVLNQIFRNKTHTRINLKTVSKGRVQFYTKLLRVILPYFCLTKETARMFCDANIKWHVYPQFSSCSSSCRQTPVRHAAIRFPDRWRKDRARLRPQPPSAVPPMRTGCWRARGQSSTPRSGCTALLTQQRRRQPGRTTPTTFRTAPTPLPSTPAWYV